MALLPAHEVYLENLSAAFGTWMTALAQSLTLQDSPTEYHVSDFSAARFNLDNAYAALAPYFSGVGPPSLVIYRDPSTFSGPQSVSPLLGAQLPRLL